VTESEARGAGGERARDALAFTAYGVHRFVLGYRRYVNASAGPDAWTGLDFPDFTPGKPPDYRPPENARGDDAIRGDHPFVLQSDGRGWLYAGVGLMPALDPNVHIQEVKAATCDIRPGRRPRGPELLAPVASYPGYEEESSDASR
jgi:hypothetical protein